jgi:hypothetical protein
MKAKVLSSACSFFFYVVMQEVDFSLLNRQLWPLFNNINVSTPPVLIIAREGCSFYFDYRRVIVVVPCRLLSCFSDHLV